jgi:hypothetical protein
MTLPRIRIPAMPPAHEYQEARYEAAHAKWGRVMSRDQAKAWMALWRSLNGDKPRAFRKIWCAGEGKIKDKYRGQGFDSGLLYARGRLVEEARALLTSAGFDPNEGWNAAVAKTVEAIETLAGEGLRCTCGACGYGLTDREGN